MGNGAENVVEEGRDSLSESIENWKSYIVQDMNDPVQAVTCRDEIPRDTNDAVQKILEIHQGFNDRFKTLSEITDWIDDFRNRDYKNLNGNCEMILGKRGVKLVVWPPDSELKKEGIYFKDEFWGNGDWCKMDNSIDIVVFIHIFSELVDSLDKY